MRNVPAAVYLMMMCDAVVTQQGYACGERASREGRAVTRVRRGMRRVDGLIAQRARLELPQWRLGK